MGPGGPPQLLVVDDDAELRQLLCTYLQGQGFEVTALPSAEAMFAALQANEVDAIVLDVGLPGLSGLDACSRLRATGHATAVLLLTARGDEIDRVLGLEMGADDYLVKPFSSRELVARLRAVLRRLSPSRASGEVVEVPIGDYVYTVAERCLRRGNDVRPLSAVEHAILAELVARPGVTVSRQRLISVSHAHGSEVSLRSVDAAVMRLRKAIEPVPDAPRHLQTVRGQGYVFVPLRHPGRPVSAHVSA